MLQLIPSDLNIDFIRWRTPAMLFSGAIMMIGILSLVLKGGPNYGIDFAGGLLVHVRVDPSVTIEEVRQVADATHVGAISVQQFESQPGEYLLRVPTADESMTGGVAATLKDGLRAAFASKGFEELRTEMVGPQVGKDLRRRGMLAVLFATIVMGLYIAVRFEFWFGVGAGVALFHDVLVVIGALSLNNVEIDLTILAALLTVVGYSVNDTVVVSDRIRENMRKDKRTPLAKLINDSLNQTLSRTILTGGTTFMVLIVLFLYGGGTIHGFAFTLIIGLLIGTYSSIFIASPIVEMWSGAGKEPPTAAVANR
jgi:preprotein translocase subunit SecF